MVQGASFTRQASGSRNLTVEENGNCKRDDCNDSCEESIKCLQLNQSKKDMCKESKTARCKNSINGAI